MKEWIIAGIFILLGAGVVWAFHKRGWERKRLFFLSAFLLSLCLAYVWKGMVELPAVSNYIPLNNVWNIKEHGYMSILMQLFHYALPFFLPGLLLFLVFPGVNLLTSLLLGLLLPLIFRAPGLMLGDAFIVDEFLFGAIGMVTGSSFLVFLNDLFYRTFEKFGIGRPGKWRFRIALLFLAVVYFGVAATMIVDYGDPYGQLTLFKSEVPLPEDTTIEVELDERRASTAVYSGSREEPLTLANNIAQIFGFQFEVQQVDSRYAASDGARTLLVSDSGEWEYNNGLANPDGDLISDEAAIAAALSFFEEYPGLTTTPLSTVLDIVPYTRAAETLAFDDSGMERPEYDAYVEDMSRPVGKRVMFNVQIDSFPLYSTNEITVTVFNGGSVARVLKTGPDVVEDGSCNILSAKEAFDVVLAGESACTLFLDAQRAVINGVTLQYMRDSSTGYYLPVWFFAGTAYLDDGSELAFEAVVPAKI